MAQFATPLLLCPGCGGETQAPACIAPLLICTVCQHVVARKDTVPVCPRCRQRVSWHDMTFDLDKSVCAAPATPQGGR